MGLHHTPPQLQLWKLTLPPRDVVGSTFFSLKWRERMNLDITGAIFLLCCAILLQLHFGELGLIHCANSSCRRRFPRMTSIKCQSRQEENYFCFWFLTDGWWKYWLYNPNIKATIGFLRCVSWLFMQVYFPVNIRVKKIVIWHVF